MLSFETVDSPSHPLTEAVRRLFRDYQAELGIDLCFQGFEEELATLPGKYGPPRGRLLVIQEDDRSLACGGLRDLGDNVCELKRIYVEPNARGRGLGKLMSERLMEEGRLLGYDTVRLDTLKRLETAIQLYEKLGFRRIPAYNHNPEPDVAYFERALD